MTHFLDEEGGITELLERVLGIVYLRYASSLTGVKNAVGMITGESEMTLPYSSQFTMSREDCNTFCRATNGEAMSDETFQECLDYFDCTEDERLTFKGFMQLYQLQTENDPSETEADLKSWGFDPITLEPITAVPVPDTEKIEGSIPSESDVIPVASTDAAATAVVEI